MLFSKKKQNRRYKVSQHIPYIKYLELCFGCFLKFHTCAIWSFNSAGRVLPLQGKSRRFEPYNDHHIFRQIGEIKWKIIKKKWKTFEKKSKNYLIQKILKKYLDDIIKEEKEGLAFVGNKNYFSWLTEVFLQKLDNKTYNNEDFLYTDKKDFTEIDIKNEEKIAYVGDFLETVKKNKGHKKMKIILSLLKE